MATWNEIDSTQIEHYHNIQSFSLCGISHFRVDFSEGVEQVAEALPETIFTDEKVVNVKAKN